MTGATATPEEHSGDVAGSGAGWSGLTAFGAMAARL